MCIAREGDVIINGTCDIEADMNQDIVVWCGLTLRFTCIEVCGGVFWGTNYHLLFMHTCPPNSSIALLLCVCVCVCVRVRVRVHVCVRA